MSWGTATIGELCKTGSGGTPARTNAAYYGGDIPWVKSGELDKGIILETEEQITEAALKKTAVKMVPPGAILIAMYGATIGKMAELAVPATTNQAICHIVPPEDRLSKDFLRHFLQAHKPQLIARGAGGAQPNISQQIIRETKIPLPPLEEQRRIAAILDKADALRRKRREALALLDTLTQSIFVEMFGDPALHEFSQKSVPLRKLTTKIGSGSTPRGGQKAYKEAGIPLIRSMNVHDLHFTDRGLVYVDKQQADRLANVTLVKGDVLLNITGASVARVCSLPDRYVGGRVNQHVAIIRPIQERLRSRYLATLLACPSVKTKLLSIGSGGTREALTKTQISDFMIVAPSIEDQLEFEHRVQALERTFDQYTTSQARFDALFTSLQSRAFNGTL